jgi:hypothetical protein
MVRRMAARAEPKPLTEDQRTERFCVFCPFSFARKEKIKSFFRKTVEKGGGVCYTNK